MKESLVEVQVAPPTQMSAMTGDEICCALPDRVDFGNVPIGAVAYRLVVVKNLIDPKLMAALGIPKVRCRRREMIDGVQSGGSVSTHETLCSHRTPHVTRH